MGPVGKGPAGRVPAPTDRQQIGRAGEDAVARWYEAHGYRIVARNWRAPAGERTRGDGTAGEIDLIAANAKAVVFCEVKTRTSDRFGSPADAVTRLKQMGIRRLAARWLGLSSGELRSRVVRFDVASVVGADVDVIEAAF